MKLLFSKPVDVDLAFCRPTVGELKFLVLLVAPSSLPLAVEGLLVSLVGASLLCFLLRSAAEERRSL